MKTKKTILIIVSIIVVLGLIWYFFMRNKQQPAVLSTGKPETGAISTSVTATGTVEPVDTVTVGTQVSGTISALYADFNSTVKKRTAAGPAGQDADPGYCRPGEGQSGTSTE